MSSAPRPPMLHVENLHFSYAGGPRVLRGLSFTLAPGDLAALVGPNGCGKSTLISVVSGVRPAAEGSVCIGGRALTAMSKRERARQTAVLPQAVPASIPFKVAEVVRMGRFPHRGLFGSFSPADRDAVELALEETDTRVFRDKPVGRLSGGERRRVFLAKALAQEPQLLVLDEPTASLDLHYQLQILRLIRDLHATKDLTVLAVLHDLDLASLFFDRVLMMHEGTIVADGRP